MPKHKWIGWGYDTTICEYCRVNSYAVNGFSHDGNCEDYERDLAEFHKLRLDAELAIIRILQKIKEYLSPEEWEEMNFGAYGRYSEYIDKMISPD